MGLEKTLVILHQHPCQMNKLRKNQLEIPNTEELQVGERIWGQPGLPSEFQASLVWSSQPPHLHLKERAGEVLTLKASSKIRCRVKTVDIIWWPLQFPHSAKGILICPIRWNYTWAVLLTKKSTNSVHGLVWHRWLCLPFCLLIFFFETQSYTKWFSLSSDHSYPPASSSECWEYRCEPHALVSVWTLQFPHGCRQICRWLRAYSQELPMPLL